jgi:AcrR family transcriptional regulator
VIATCEDGGMAKDDKPARVGRPRAVPDAGSPLSPREQILDAAAALFAEHGLSGTSTRAIAERVGIRQASLYYHFAGKDDLLVELLTRSVRPASTWCAASRTSSPSAPPRPPPCTRS